jgi:hypothetical protein
LLAKQIPVLQCNHLIVPLPLGSSPPSRPGFAIGETKSSRLRNTGPRAAFFIEDELPDGVESGQTRPLKSIVLMAVRGRPEHRTQS